jgi:hypothetical protein
MKFRFSVHGLFVLTAVFAVAITLANMRDGGVSDYCLSALTSLIAVGLVQQVVLPEGLNQRTPGQGVLRRLCLLLILACLGFFVFRALTPYQVVDPLLFGDTQIHEVSSEAAEPLWIFCLLLGSITAPWMSLPVESIQQKRNRLRSALISVAVTGSLYFYLATVLRDAMIIPALVDIAINGVEVSQAQTDSALTSHYVEWFGRTPNEFRQFLEYQYLMWPMLCFATILLVSICQRNVQSAAKIVLLCAAVALAIPAVINVAWLSNGAALRLFPRMVNNYWNDISLDLVMMPFGIALLTMYFGTRRAGSSVAVDSNLEPRRYASDSVFVGIFLMAAGVGGIVDAISDYLDLRNSPEWLPFIPGLLSSPDPGGELFAVLGDTLLYPHYSYQSLLLPCGLYWLWRRLRFPSNRNGERWPQVDSHQAFYLPILFVAVALFIVASVPFGFSLVHLNF